MSRYVKIFESSGPDQPVVQQQQQQLPIMQFYETPTPLQTAVFKALTWSFDGDQLYVLTANASVMVMRVMPLEVRGTIVTSWSPAASSGLNPCQYSLARSMCVSMPTVANSLLQQSQIALICSLDRCTAGVRDAYLLRILNDGKTRLTDLSLHKSIYPATGLLYNISGNVIYWSTYNEWPFSKISSSVTHDTWASSGTKRRILQVDLSVDYNIVSIQDFSMSMQQLVMPNGATFESAAVMPRSNVLFAYIPTSASTVDLFLFNANGNFTRPRNDMYLSFRSLPTSNFLLPPRVFFTEQGRFFVHRPADADIIKKYSECVGKIPCFLPFHFPML